MMWSFQPHSSSLPAWDIGLSNPSLPEVSYAKLYLHLCCSPLLRVPFFLCFPNTPHTHTHTHTHTHSLSLSALPPTSFAQINNCSYCKPQIRSAALENFLRLSAWVSLPKFFDIVACQTYLYRWATLFYDAYSLFLTVTLSRAGTASPLSLDLRCPVCFLVCRTHLLWACRINKLVSE